MRRILTLVRKDIAIFRTDSVAIGLTFIVPLVMIMVFGLVFGNAGEDPVPELRVLSVNGDTGTAGQRLIAALDSLDELDLQDRSGSDTIAVDSARAYELVRDGSYSAALIVPRDFSEGIKDGELRLSVLEDPRDPVTAGVLVGMTQKQAFETFPMLMMTGMLKGMVDSGSVGAFNTDVLRSIRKNFAAKIPDSITSLTALIPDAWVFGDTVDTASSGGFGVGEAFDRVNKVQREEVVGQNITNPGMAQSTAGVAVMFMLFGVGAIAASLLREMHAGTAQRLLLSGATANEILLSKSLYAVLMGSVQLCAMMLYAWLIFDLEIFLHPFALLTMIVVTSLAMSAVGLLISSFSRTEEQASGFQVVIILSMSALGGAMVPSFLLPDLIRTIAWVTPVHWAMQGFTDIFWRQVGLTGIVEECGVLIAMATVFLTISVLTFRRRLASELG